MLTCRCRDCVGWCRMRGRGGVSCDIVHRCAICRINVVCMYAWVRYCIALLQ